MNNEKTYRFIIACLLTVFGTAIGIVIGGLIVFNWVMGG
jgi:hypothetical protein